MRIHLDPVGGVAGDMFAAALLDGWPELLPEMEAAFVAAGLFEWVRVELRPHDDKSFVGARFVVTQTDSGAEAHGHHHPHRSFRRIRTWLGQASLPAEVRVRALAIFTLLAEAEGEVHGKDPADVAFHEVGAWDSIADIVAAAWLIERLGALRWSCSTLPIGRGTIDSAHGALPLPAPATAALLAGFPVTQDGVEGERVTPTGAAILRHLAPDFGAQIEPERLARRGIGFGTRILPGRSNMLRVLSFEPDDDAPTEERLAVCQFEVDDQTPEALAQALERLRAFPGVIDVLQTPVYGKKGRLATQVQVLTGRDARAEVIDRCLLETTTLGVRWHEVRRTALVRREEVASVDGRAVRVKIASRPGGAVTGKAEIDDLEGNAHGQREILRRTAEAAALGDEEPHGGT